MNFTIKRVLLLLATGLVPASLLAQTATATATATSMAHNPYGLQAMWASGDWVSKAALLTLVAMSLGSWTILLNKLWQSVLLARQARAAHAQFFSASDLQQGLSRLPPDTALHFIAKQAIAAGEHHEGTLTQHIDRNTWVTMNIERAVGEVQSRLQNGLAFLATVGSTAPFVGLFGTVWGIYHALTAIGIAGQASIDKVAGPVGEALIMTAIGLGVAVPAVLGYNWLCQTQQSQHGCRAQLFC